MEYAYFYTTYFLLNHLQVVVFCEQRRRNGGWPLCARCSFQHLCVVGTVRFVRVSRFEISVEVLHPCFSSD